jgi:hypothetical protein
VDPFYDGAWRALRARTLEIAIRAGAGVVIETDDDVVLYPAFGIGVGRSRARA